jgi:hypothetical protein
MNTSATQPPDQLSASVQLLKRNYATSGDSSFSMSLSLGRFRNPAGKDFAED